MKLQLHFKVFLDYTMCLLINQYAALVLLNAIHLSSYLFWSHLSQSVSLSMLKLFQNLLFFCNRGKDTIIIQYEKFSMRNNECAFPQCVGNNHYKVVFYIINTGVSVRTDPGLMLVNGYPHKDKNSLFVSVASIVPWQRCHISMETQPYICLWFGWRCCSWW